MKKQAKIIVLTSSLFIAAILLLFIGGSYLLHKTIKGTQETNLSYIQSVKAIISQNAEGNAEKDVKSSSLREDYQHLSIYYKKEFADLLPLTKEILEESMTRSEELFGETSPVPFDLLVFESYEELTAFSKIEKTNGLYSDFHKVIAIHYWDKELILTGEKKALHNFRYLILHEYTHYAFSRKDPSQSAYPMWFIEGTAEYAATDPTEANFPYFDKIAFERLNNSEQWQAALTNPLADPYLQSYYAFEYLTTEFGEDVIGDIMESVKETNDFNKSFEEITGMTLEELGQLFIRSYEQLAE